MKRLRRIAIVNRGEAAMRLVHAARDLGDDIVTIALHTQAERRAMFVREADEGVCFEDLDVPITGTPYLDLVVLEAALAAATADAVWVGWGFVAERPEFADLCADLDLTFIGPSGDVMRRLGDKIAAKKLAEAADVPLAPWSGGPVTTPDEALAAAGDVGFPLMVKAAAGGGGRGIRRVDREEDLTVAVERASAEAASSFGDATLFLERVVTGARHVEVQIIADHHGNVWAPGVRDCSLQRRNQKVVEESSSTALDAAQEERLRNAAIRLARESRYTNAGTVEFLYQPDEGLLAFLEVNTRLQVEHPVTEVTAGIDLVKLQLHVAAGGRLEGECPAARGHAFEARLNAEDPAAGFAPAPGRIESLVLPAGPGVRVDAGVAAGDAIAPEYDSMIAKIIAWGETREEARIRLRRALSGTTVLVEGGTTNKSFLLDLVDRSEVVRGELDTNWLDRLTAVNGHRSDRHAQIGLIVAAIDVHEERSRLDRVRFLSSAARGRPETDPGVGHEIELRWRGAEHRVHVATGDLRGWYRLTLDGAAVDVVLERLDEVHARLSVGGRSHRVVSQSNRSDHLVEVDGVVHRFSRDDGGLVRAPAVSLVVSVDVGPGDVVAANQRVAVVEAMKMETTVSAPADGVVEHVFVTPNTQVDAGAPLLRITSNHGDADAGATDERLRFDQGGDGVGTMARIDVLRAMLLGFDLADDVDMSMVTEYRADQSMDDPEVRMRELALLQVFADLCGLTRERRISDGAHGLEARSPREHFHAYLRSFDADGEGVPERFRSRLLDALGHYGIDSLERTDQLEAAVYRIHRSAQRRREQLPVITALLERRLEHCGPDRETDALRDTLDSLLAASQARYPSIGNLARSVRHRCIDRPILEVATSSVQADLRASLQSLIEDPADHALRDHLVASPLPLMKTVAELDALIETADVRAAITDVLIRRFYKIRVLRDIERRSSPHPIVSSWYHHRERDVRVIGVGGDLADVHDLLDGLRGIAAETVESTAVVDLYLRIDPETTVHDVASVLELTLASVELPAVVRRVAVVAAESGPMPGGGRNVYTLTWNRDGETWVEEVVFRGLHPMITRRLNLWRLENFDVTRVPSADDTHVFDCVAIDQPTDERLIAVAEVRDITPLRDADGTLVALPELERVLASCLDGIRQAQAEVPDRQRLEWNRVMLFVWPPVEMSLAEMNTVARRLVPMTTDLGLEQVMVQGRIVDPTTEQVDDVVVRIGYQAGSGMDLQITEPPTAPMQPLDDYARKVLQCRRRGAIYPYELVPLLAGDGSFEELDLVDDELVPVDRERGLNDAGIIVGRVTTPTAKHPEGMTRIAMFGDPTRSMGSIAEAECRRLLAALDLAEATGVPVEWFALSAGARIAMDSGSENLDWVASVLRRIVEFTQAGGEVNVIVAGVNVGAQPYWNAEATMLMHTKGILVMTPDSTMVLTGKQAIDFSGGVSADDNIGIGGHERVMGPNGQAQYWSHDLPEAIEILFAHYDHSYVAPGEEGPRRAVTADPVDRDVCAAPHDGVDGGFTTVGEIFAAATNPDRKKPFDIRSVMRAVIDADHPPLERWTDMAEAEGSVVWDAHLGGYSSTVVGIESRPLTRSGPIPADGPGSWSAGTLFPLSSKKVARAINASSGNRPVVVLANLSGFDGSPESLRRLQLEYGAEIGRAIVNFDGPIVLCVVSRYHGGAFVVFSGRLNDRMQVLAVEGAHASVIGGAPAAAVVFTREVNARTQADERVQRLEKAISVAPVHERAHLRSELASVQSTVRNEMLGAVADEFDAVHSVQRAKDVGSVHEIIRAERLRPDLVAAIERGVTDAAVTSP
ncbi:MAG: carboxyl transferase domain-containing protein [Acidimicrobiales bacterium]|nr:carboxyl transferase domain-containing protein [Acidimicrobiales bacterium]